MKLTLSVAEKEAINNLLGKIKQGNMDEMVEKFSFIKQDSHDHVIDYEITNSMFKRVVDILAKCIDDVYNPITVMLLIPRFNKIKKELISITDLSVGTRSAFERLTTLSEELTIYPEASFEWRTDGKLVVSLFMTAHICEVKVDHKLLTDKIAKEVIYELSLASTSMRLSLNEKRKFISTHYAKKVELNLIRLDDAISHFNYQFKKLAGK